MQTFPLALILASIPFMTSMGITPGPNNILVASSGVNFGFRATIPHVLGITIGYPLMLFIVGIQSSSNDCRSCMVVAAKSCASGV